MEFFKFFLSDANKSLASSMMIKIRVHTFIFCSDSDQPLATPTLPLSRSDAPFLWPFTFPCSHPSASLHLPAAQVALFWGVLASFLRSPAGCLISVLFSEKLQPEGDASSCRPVTVLFALGTYSVPPELCLVGICKLRGSWPADQRAPWVSGARSVCKRLSTRPGQQEQALPARSRGRAGHAACGRAAAARGRHCAVWGAAVLPPDLPGLPASSLSSGLVFSRGGLLDTGPWLHLPPPECWRNIACEGCRQPFCLWLSVDTGTREAGLEVAGLTARWPCQESRRGGPRSLERRAPCGAALTLQGLAWGLLGPHLVSVPAPPPTSPPDASALPAPL